MPSKNTRPSKKTTAKKTAKDFNSIKQEDLPQHTEVATGEALTTNQGVKINDDQNLFKTGERGWKILYSGKKLHILIMNVYLNG